VIRKLDGTAVDLAKRDAVRLDRERIADRLSVMQLNPNEGTTAERAYRRGWNDALENVRRELDR
jgi:hypothetical protein